MIESLRLSELKTPPSGNGMPEPRVYRRDDSRREREVREQVIAAKQEARRRHRAMTAAMSRRELREHRRECEGCKL